MGGVKTKRVVFVTVGTTCFDALVKSVDSETVQKELLAKGYTHLLIQMGRGSYLPTKVVTTFTHFLQFAFFFVSYYAFVICNCDLVMWKFTMTELFSFQCDYVFVLMFCVFFVETGFGGSEM